MNNFYKVIFFIIVYVFISINVFSESSSHYYNQGIDALKENKIDEAFELFSKAIEIDPKNTHAYMMRSHIYKNKMLHFEALDDINKVLSIFPNDFSVIFERANVYLNIRKFDKAIKDLDYINEFNPDNFNGFKVRGIVYLEKGDYKKSLVDFNKAIKLNPGDFISYAFRGIVYGKLKQYKKAEKNFKKSFQIKKDNFFTYFLLAKYYEDLKEFDAAINEYYKCLALNETFSIAYVSIASLYILIEEYDKSLSAIEKVQVIDPENHYIQPVTAFINYLNGNYKEAINNYNKVNYIIKYEPFTLFFKIITASKISKSEYEKALQELENNINNYKDNKWDFLLAKYFLGEIDKKVLEENTDNIKNRTFDIYFYTGCKNLFKGNLNLAEEYFSKCIDDDYMISYEYIISKYELKLISETKKKIALSSE